MRAAIITPTYRTDLALTRNLCRSIDRFVTPDIHHYVLVSKRDYHLFEDMKSSRRTVLVLNEFLPAGFFQVPLPARMPITNKRLREWWKVPGRWRTNGWLIQQIVKLSSTSISDAEVFIFIDSDVTLLRQLDVQDFLTEGRVRLFHAPGATASLAPQQRWHRIAGSLLGIPSKSYYGADYIGNIITWHRDVLVALQNRVTQVTGKPWQIALAQLPTVSEYILYGIFYDHVFDTTAGPHIHAETSLTLDSWGYDLSQEAERARFIGDLRPEHIGVLLQSTEDMPLDESQNLLERLQAVHVE